MKNRYTSYLSAKMWKYYGSSSLQNKKYIFDWPVVQSFVDIGRRDVRPLSNEIMKQPRRRDVMLSVQAATFLVNGVSVSATLPPRHFILHRVGSLSCILFASRYKVPTHTFDKFCLLLAYTSITSTDLGSVFTTAVLDLCRSVKSPKKKKKILLNVLLQASDKVQVHT